MPIAKDCVRMNQELLDVLDTLLATEGWDAGILLQVSKKKLQEAREATAMLMAQSESLQESQTSFHAGAQKEGHQVVYIVLHQATGGELKDWANAVKSLVHQSFGRPVYLDSESAQRVVAAKHDKEREGYVVAYIKDSDIVERPAHRKLRDNFGQELVTLKHGGFAIKNMIEFVLSNTKHYAFHQNRLVSKDSIV